MRHAIGYVTTFVGGFAACAAILNYAGIGRAARPVATPTPPAARATIEETLADKAPARPAQAGLPSIADAVARLEPAVVNIDVSGTRESRGTFGLFRGGREPFSGSGSGIIVSEDGYVVTNNHVVEPVSNREGELTIQLSNGKEYRNVSIVGRDPQTDLAVLKIGGAKGLPTAELGDSDTLRVGDWAIAVGNPLGFNSTVTLGIVSALNRRNFRNDTDALDRVIQTDAAINPGNSGGALADIEGRVVGINTAIASQNGGSVGIGFAIPINAAKRVIEQLIKTGRVVRPYLGIVYQPVETLDRDALPDGVTLPEDGRGAVIVNDGNGAVRPGSPAEKAGLREYDVLRAIDGKEVTDTHTIRDTVLAHDVGDTVTVTLWRDGETREVTLTLEEMPGGYLPRE
jgi:serine protease Do